MSGRPSGREMFDFDVSNPSGRETVDFYVSGRPSGRELFDFDVSSPSGREMFAVPRPRSSPGPPDGVGSAVLQSCSPAVPR